MAVYSGSRTMDGVQVLVDGEPLDHRYDLKRFTSSGFEWTYEGGEPAQLSLALLAHHLSDEQRALDLHASFMRRVVANLENDWELTSEEVEEALKGLA